MSTLLDCWQIEQDTMNGKTLLPIVYIDRRVGEIVLREKTERREEFVGYKMKQVQVRPLTHDEGAIGSTLVMLNRDDYLTVVRRKALAKLTLEEREALGLGINIST
jgi:hypothetical protein